MKTYLITGGAGFIGSNFIHYLLNKYGAEVSIINVDKLTYAGNLLNLSNIDTKNYHFFKADISDKIFMAEIFQHFRPEVIVNFAAETHVDRSIVDPDIFITANVLGTQSLLDTALKYPVKKFVQISTDEVYGSMESGLASEGSALNPSSPYSASKASADLLARAYYKTYGLPVVIGRCTNNYGPRQFPEKLIPLVIKKCLNNQPIPVYGDGKNVRDWLFVNDHCDAIYAIASKAPPGEVYNICSGSGLKNLEIISLVIEIVLASIPGNDERRKLAGTGLIHFVNDRPGHDRRYAIDSAKIQRELNWQPRVSVREGIKQTVAWYLQNYWIMEDVNS